MRALDCLLGYATAHVRTGAALLDTLLELVTGVPAGRAGDEAVAIAIGVHLPLLHRYAGMFTAAHPHRYALSPGRTTPAAPGRVRPSHLARRRCWP